MTASAYRESATIYQFSMGGRRDEAEAVDKFAAPRIARVASGGAWYPEGRTRPQDVTSRA